ncbi:MAG: S46 family peptidase, partial [Crocinitomicaceae bacterium]
MKRRILTSIIFSFYSFFMILRAEEGMLIPSLISAFESDMKAKGMKLSADDIYSINITSLMDAILQFGG